MKIQHKEAGDEGSFYMSESGDIKAEILYTRSGDTLVIHHTEVEEALRGKNFGNELVEQVVAYARKDKLRINPVCQFAKAVFEKKKEYGDVMA